MQQIILGDIHIDVVHKNIKNVHLSVHPPNGRVRVSAPLRMDIDTIRVFVISKLGWIKKQQVKLREQVRESPREYINRESHYYLGKRYLLKVIESSMPAKIVRKHDILELHIDSNSSSEKRRTTLENWYRQQLKEIVPKYIQKWEAKINVKVKEYANKKDEDKMGHL